MQYQVTCLDCRLQFKVPRHEFDRARKPRCLRCGGPIDLSSNAARQMANAQSAKAGDKPKGRARAEEPERIVPVREATRYDFWDHPDLYQWSLYDTEKKMGKEAAKRVRDMGPVRFYEGSLTDAFRYRIPSDQQYASEFIHMSELAAYRSGRPYYKVWPSIASALCHTEMRVDGAHFRMPYEGMIIRFPKKDSPMGVVNAMIAARIPPRMHTDGREWSFGLTFFDNVEEFWDRDDAGQYWVADIPVRPGLSMEDALDQTALLREVPDPDLARRAMRVAVGVCFFGIDRHEVILPEVTRKVIERFQRERRPPTASEAKKALDEARSAGMFGFKVGSEIDLPTAEVGPCREASEGKGEQLTHGHVRRGFMRFQPHGPKLQERRLQFIGPTVVRPDLPLQVAGHGYRVRVT